eukprot:UN32403
MKAIFSLWDYSDSVKNAVGRESWCTRFGGEGEGSHCMINYTFTANVRYEFRVYYSQYDVSKGDGSQLSAVVKNTQTRQESYIGSLISKTVNGRKPTLFKNPSCSFMEYFTGGNFYSAAGT